MSQVSNTVVTILTAEDAHIVPMVGSPLHRQTCHRHASCQSPADSSYSSIDPSRGGSTDVSTPSFASASEPVCRHAKSRRPTNCSSSRRIALRRSYIGRRDEATYRESSCARISCAISKHSSSKDEQTACDAGTIPPGPKNLPSTRFLIHQETPSGSGNDTTRTGK